LISLGCSFGGSFGGGGGGGGVSGKSFTVVTAFLCEVPPDINAFPKYTNPANTNSAAKIKATRFNHKEPLDEVA